MSDPRRRLLLRAFAAALARVTGRSVTHAALASSAASAAPGSRAVAAIGKAAASMALGAHDALGAAIADTLIITKHGHVPEEARRVPGARILEAAHPLPDATSLAAGAVLLHWVEALPAGILPLFLVSGGASSLAEVLRAGGTLEELRALNERGLAAGWHIGELNAARAQLSALKGGGLTRSLGGRPAQALFISDVPGDDPAVIGSGLLAPCTGDCVARRIVATVEEAMTAAAQAAAHAGIECRVAPQRFGGPAEDVARDCVRALESNGAGLCVWGGESTVRLPRNPGRGGRNQQLALLAARCIAGRDDLLLLAAGTDGTDGPTEEAGALVDGGTSARIVAAGLDVDGCLARADAGTALAASGDLLRTGPTGTNVGDLVIGACLAPVL